MTAMQKETTMTPGQRRGKRFDVFLSYSSSERDSCVVPFLKRLDETGIRTWCDVRNIMWGDSVVEAIGEGMNDASLVIAFVSRSYLEKPWPLKELYVALSCHSITAGALLPVFVGVTTEEVNTALPLLSDIRHLRIASPSADATITRQELDLLVAELIRKRDKLVEIRVTESRPVGQLPEAVSTVRYSPAYHSVWMSSLKSAMDAAPFTETARPSRDSDSAFGRVLDLEGIMTGFFSHCSLPEKSIITCSDMIGAHIVFGLQSGNVVSSGCGYVRESLYDRFDYQQTGAPPNPIKITCGIFPGPALWYSDGTVWLCSGRKAAARQLLPAFSGPVSALTTSYESRIVAGSAAGELSLWSAKDHGLVRSVTDGEPGITSVAINKDADPRLVASGQANGIVRFFTLDGVDTGSASTGDTPIRALGFFPPPYQCLIVAHDTHLSVWDWGRSMSLCDIPLSDHRCVTDLHVAETSEFRSPDQVTVVAGFQDGAVQRWQLLCS